MVRLGLSAYAGISTAVLVVPGSQYDCMASAIIPIPVPVL